MNFKLALVKNKNRWETRDRGTRIPGSIPSLRTWQTRVFFFWCNRERWVIFLGFSINPGISCPGVNQEKLPAKCLPFPVMVGWCLAGSFFHLLGKNSLSPWQQISWDNRQFLFFFFFLKCENWFKKADLAFPCRLLDYICFLAGSGFNDFNI